MNSIFLNWKGCFCFLAGLLLFSSSLWAEVPGIFSYQGYLTDLTNAPVTGSRNMTFYIYDALEEGNLLWTESHSDVQITDGLFTVVLGETTSLSGLAFDGSYYLTFSVGEDSPFSQRLELNSIAIALGGVEGVEGAMGAMRIGSHVGVGFDVSTSENYGSSTVLLKENNTRIFIGDVRETLNHPSSDWYLRANENVSEGASSFDILDVSGSDYTVEWHVNNGEEVPRYNRVVGFAAGAGDSSLYIANSGKTGIGTSAPEGFLSIVKSSDDVSVAATTAVTGSTATARISAGSSEATIATTGGTFVSIIANDEVVVNIEGGGALTMSDGGSYNGTWNPASSREKKQSIESLPCDEAVAALKKLAPSSYVYKSRGDDSRLGFIAEDLPELVATLKKNNVSSTEIVALLTKVLQEQRKTLAKQSMEISEINSRIGAMEQAR